MVDAWGGSFGSSWGVSWGSGGTPPVVVPVDTGGSGNQAHGRSSRGSGRRNVNDDPEAFSELLKEWRERKHHHEKPVQKAHVSDHREDARADYPQEVEAQADELLEQVRRIEAAYDRSMVAYEAALAQVEQAKAVKAQKAAKAKQAAIRQAAIERERLALEQEEQARQQAMQLAIEWELARLAYEDFLEDEDEIMLLS